MVPSFTASVTETSSCPSTFKDNITTSNVTKRAPSSSQEVGTSHLFSIRQQLIALGISPSSADTIMSSWRDGTKAQYQTYISKWTTFCSVNDCNFFNPSIPMAIGFLQGLFDQGLSYNSINTARSALSALLQIKETTVPFGQLPLVKRFMKGVFELRPSFPRYDNIWDINKVFTFFREKPNMTDLSLKELTVKLTFLLLLLSGQRCQTIHLLSIDNMLISDDKCVFHVRDKVKQTRVAHHIAPIVFEKYPKETTLCVVAHLTEYLQRTQKLREVECRKLLISYVKPHKAVSRETISRWCKWVLERAGIDTGKFGSHSTRAASTSTVARTADIGQILKSVGWSNARTFQHFYNKPLETSFNLGSSILNAV